MVIQTSKLDDRTGQAMHKKIVMKHVKSFFLQQY